ncbi:hypothetical protein [Faecalibaculum rodentium]|jgi:hypothetical protein|uniref:hypothetical protein n=1 Tax=Faecalibaculum rodentium TaxID=1702221 RepID=UPI0025A68640|nr:hypothetical protein [Faecalibaculum rodentium]
MTEEVIKKLQYMKERLLKELTWEKDCIHSSPDAELCEPEYLDGQYAAYEQALYIVGREFEKEIERIK